ncbi:MAG: hypothetical protein QM682_02760 [Paracoccus sp. (in: a-proteobacteria)]|uniref:hypothetical protein n=1 Tax=Paracoccus sp. TaxID=267 RepID=UPI0039E6D43C
MILAKPPHGQPCNGCGLCCMAERCPLAVVVFGPGDRCPALEDQGGLRFGCGLIANPLRYAPRLVKRHGGAAVSAAAAVLVGAGHGCDAQTPGEPYDFEAAARMRAGLDHDAAEAAARIWIPRG